MSYVFSRELARRLKEIKCHLYFLQTQKCSAGTKPCLLFSGQVFENDAIYKRLKSILIGELKHLHCHGPD